MQETSLKFFMISLISVCKDISAGINVICSCTSTSITVKKKKRRQILYETGKKEFYPTIQQLWGRESVLHDNQSTSIFLIFKKMNNIPLHFE